MESTKTHLTPTFELCEEKAAKVMRWLAESNDLSIQTFAVSRAFEHGVLQENTTTFLRLILDERLSGKKVEHEIIPQELQQILTQAFTYTYRYLLTPLSFTPEYLSFASEAVHINVKMLARLSSLVDYPYFPEMLEEWFTITSQSSASEDRKTALMKFVSDVDHSIMRYSTPSEIAVYLQPLFEFHSSETIDRLTVEILLTDKDLALPTDNKQKEFSAEELSFFLYEAYCEWKLTPAIAELPPIPEYNTFLQELREVGVVLPPPHLHFPAEEKKILPPLEMFISSKLRNKCLEKIFHENEHEYNRAISMLNSIEDFSQSELNLNTLLQIHKVAQDSKVATRLSEALRLRFSIPLPIDSQK